MTSEGTLDDRYFAWLYSKVAASRNRNPARSYWELCKILYSVPFQWFVAHDDNRAENGKALRFEFMEDKHAERDESWLELDCSILEMLVAFSRVASFETGVHAMEWFWIMVQNLGLRHFTDEVYRVDLHEDHILFVLERLVQRTYEANGDGGLFPLRHPERDQREIDIWYQFSASLLEDGIYH